MLTKKNMPSDSRYGLKRAMSSKKVREEWLPLEESCEAPGKEQVGMFERESLCLYVELWSGVRSKISIIALVA